jgi:Tfp pilus assembly protein PilF
MAADFFHPRLGIMRAAFWLVWAGLAQATPYLPASGAQVVERLPSPSDPAQRELRRLRAELATSPDKLPLAAALARRYIEQARIEGDPRYLGYAQAVLAPWWKRAQPPLEVLVLRATLLQGNHQFAAALADLDTVVSQDSGNAQAWLTRATVLLVTGDHAAAKASCMRLYSRAPALIVQACLASVGSVSGHAAQNYAALEAALDKDSGADPAVRTWVMTLLAEMAERSGDALAAQKYFSRALASGGADSYLQGAYADFLLNQGRPAEVVNLLVDKTRVDALLLRYALALKAIHSPQAAAQTEVLRTRFEAAMLRGDTVHQREQARFELQLRNDAKNAVRLAKLNWATQKEPADLRVLLEAAVAADDKAAARTAMDWIRKTGLQDRALDLPLKKLGAGA